VLTVRAWPSIGQVKAGLAATLGAEPDALGSVWLDDSILLTKTELNGDRARVNCTALRFRGGCPLLNIPCKLTLWTLNDSLSVECSCIIRPASVQSD
jgi:hypothetical protein